MEAAPPRTRGRRLRRGTVERPLNARLVRVSFVVVAPAVLAFLFSISTTGTLQRSSLEPLFDGESAAALAATLDTEFPSRVPGSEGAADATVWYAQTVGALGLATATDTWTEDIPDLGAVEPFEEVAGRIGHRLDVGREHGESHDPIDGQEHRHRDQRAIGDPAPPGKTRRHGGDPDEHA